MMIITGNRDPELQATGKHRSECSVFASFTENGTILVTVKERLQGLYRRTELHSKK